LLQAQERASGGGFGRRRKARLAAYDGSAPAEAAAGPAAVVPKPKEKLMVAGLLVDGG